jgi:F420-non-reducing hydrogenase iron-sulfur subunit
VVLPGRAEMNNKEFKPTVIVFCCSWCGYAAADAAGIARRKMLPYFRVIRTMCTGRIDPLFILHAFKLGADGVMVVGCHPGECHYIKGNLDAEKRVNFLKSILTKTGFEERLEMQFISAGESPKFQQEVNRFVKKIQSLGPSPFHEKPESVEGRTKRQILFNHLALIFERTQTEPQPWEPTSEEELVEGFGTPVYDLEKCLGCGACYRLCPEEVIRMENSGPTRTFSHYHWSCITCRTCEENCPEEAIKIEHGFNLQTFMNRTIFKDLDLELRKCSVCENYFAPEVLVQDIKKTEELNLPDDVYNICQECKKKRAAEKLKRIFNFEPLGL